MRISPKNKTINKMPREWNGLAENTKRKKEIRKITCIEELMTNKSDGTKNVLNE